MEPSSLQLHRYLYPYRGKDTSFPKRDGTICNVPRIAGMLLKPYNCRSGAKGAKRKTIKLPPSA